MENPESMEVDVAGKIIYKWAIYTMAMLNNQMVDLGSGDLGNSKKWCPGRLLLWAQVGKEFKLNSWQQREKKEHGWKWPWGHGGEDSGVICRFEPFDFGMSRVWSLLAKVAQPKWSANGAAAVTYPRLLRLRRISRQNAPRPHALFWAC